MFTKEKLKANANDRGTFLSKKKSFSGNSMTVSQKTPSATDKLKESLISFETDRV